MIRSLALLSLAAMFGSFALYGTPITVGYLAYEPQGYFYIQNLTGIDASGPDAPVANQVSFLNPFIDYNTLLFSDCNNEFQIPQSGFYAESDGSLYTGPAQQPCEYSLTGNINTHTLSLEDGTTWTTDGAFSLTVSTQDYTNFALITVNATEVVPEPASLALFGSGVSIVLLRSKRRLVTRALAAVAISGVSAFAAGVHLTEFPTPSSGTAGLDTVQLTAEGFPASQTPVGIDVWVEPVCNVTAGAYLTEAIGFQQIFGNIGQVGFVLPYAAPTGTYAVQLVVNGVPSLNCAQISIKNSDPTWKNCPAQGSIGILAGNQATKSSAVTAYVPQGYWTGGETGVRVVPIESTGTAPLEGATDDVVNSCSGNDRNGQSACVTNGGYFYLLQGPNVTHNIPVANQYWVPGQAAITDVSLNVLTDTAAISSASGTSNGSGCCGPSFLETIALQGKQPSINGFAPWAQLGPQLYWDVYRNQVLTSSVDGLTLWATFLSNYPGGTPAGDCSTGIAAVVDSQTGGMGLQLYDLQQISYLNNGPFAEGPAYWLTAASSSYVLPEFALTSFGTLFGAAVAPGTSHLGIIAAGQTAGVFKMPSWNSTTAELVDYVEFAMPKDPDGSQFNSGWDPPSLTAYTSPSTGKSFGIIADWVSTQPRYLAVIDLAAALSAPRNAAHTIQPSYNLVQNGVLRFLATF